MPKWFKEHPGGKSYLKQGIKANSFIIKRIIVTIKVINTII